MNRIITSRLSGIAVVLILPLVFVGCLDCDTCMRMVFERCPCPPGTLEWYECMLFISIVLCNNVICEEQPEEFCERYPETCQEFDECFNTPAKEGED